MTAKLVDGNKGFRWGTASIDDAGYREYKMSYLVECDDLDDGPQTAMHCPGLPEVGSTWKVGNDDDTWVWRRPEMDCKPENEEGGNLHFRIGLTFSNKPVDFKIQRCWENPTIQDPTLEPIKITGSSHKDKEEATHDRWLQPITNSAHEPITGKSVEFDISYSTVELEMNVYELNLGFIDSLLDTVNAERLWGYPARCVKFSERKFVRKFFGVCTIYYTLTLKFEIRIKYDPITGDPYSGWDRWVLDEGTKVLIGHWDRQTGIYVADNVNGRPPNKNNPAHFIRYKDPQGGHTKALLDGAGMPIMNYPPVITGSSIAQINITNEGEYQQAPAVTFANRGRIASGQGAAAHAELTLNEQTLKKTITAIVIDNPGYGYLEAPIVNIGSPPAGGTQATADAVLSPPASCFACPSGFPLFYIINGFEGTREYINGTTLTYVADCRWEGLSPPSTFGPARPIELFSGTTLADGTPVWILRQKPTLDEPEDSNNGVLNGYIWRSTNWRCTEPSTMVEIQERRNDVTVTSGGATEPFYSFLEYYPGSDLRRLGLPVDLHTPAPRFIPGLQA